MKYEAGLSMENCLTPEALELLAKGLKSFIQDNPFIDDTIFDEISKEARFLSKNRKLAERCKSTQKKCSEARGLLKVKYAAYEKRRGELCHESSSSSSADEDTLVEAETGGVSDCEQYIPLSSRSAPATPALCLRCNGAGDLKRRSQSLEDDMANRIHQYIEQQQHLNTQQQAAETNQIPLSNSTFHLQGSSSQTDTPTNEGVATQTITSCAEYEASVMNISENTELYDSGFETPERLLEESAADDGKIQEEFISQPEPVTDTDEYTTASETSDVQSYHDTDSLCTSTSHYSMVDRGDKFIELTHDVITIPIEEFANLNNNSMKVESPSLENGIVKTFVPQAKPTGAKRSILASSSSTYSSLDSDTITEEQFSPECVFVPRVRFTGVNSDEPSEEELEPKEVDNRSCLTEPLQNANLSSHLSPVLSTKQKLTAMQKRRSFHGFTSSISLPLFNFSRNKKSTEDSIKRLSIGSNVSESQETVAKDHLQPALSQPSLDISNEKLVGIENSLKERENHRLIKNKRLDKTMSLVTASSDSLPSLPEEGVEASECEAAKLTSHIWSPIPVNTHLVNKRAANSARSTSMADLRLTESEIKSRITLSHIMDELIQTERDYVVALRLVVNHYIPELCREDVPQTLRGKRAVIFGNMEKLYEFHDRYLLGELTKCENNPYKISQCFLNHKEEFVMYAKYNYNKPKSDQLMREHGCSFFREQQLFLGDKMDLSSYLLKPVQRMGKYALILKQILKECPESSPDYSDLCSAEEMIRFCLQHGNDLLAMDAIQDCDVNLKEQGTLLLQDEFTVCKPRKKLCRHIFLFEQTIILCKPKKLGAGTDQYLYKTSLKTSDLGLTENVGSSGLKFEIWFRKLTGGSWILQAQNAQVKNRWVKAIQKLLWNQALKSREYRLTDLSAMGVGNKPCLDLKESVDNINDRFIPSFNKTRKDECQLKACKDPVEIKKRPHSIISLAGSSSSSASSNGSTGPSSRKNWMDFKGLERFTIGKPLGSSTRFRKMYKSDTRINRCDSGISSLSEGGLSFTTPIRTYSKTHRLVKAGQPAGQTEV